MAPPHHQRYLLTVTAYLVCIGLVPLYVNMFPLWKYVTTRFGSDVFVYLPAAVAVLLAAGIFIAARAGKQGHGRPLLPGPLLIGVLFCTAGLVIPDPAFPVKRIHVAEYLLLALVARFAMAPYLQGIALLLFSSCFAAALGVHDEFLQGIHPARTYGLRDMTVNALASFGGGLIGHGLSLFTRQTEGIRDNPAGHHYRLEGFYLCWLLVSVLMLIVPAVFFRGMIMETWTVVPLLASVVCFSLYRPRFRAELRHGVAALNCAAWSLACYPFMTRMESIVFY